VARINISDLLREAISIDEIARSPLRVSIVAQILCKLVSGIRSVSWGGKLRALAWNQVHYPTKILADKTGADRETVTRHLKFLEQFGFIETESHTRDGTIITLTMLSAPIDAAIHPAIDATNHATISATNDGAALRRKTPLEIPLSNVAEKTTTTARETELQPTKKQIDEAWTTWQATLEHYNVPATNIGPMEERSLYQAIKALGFEKVKDALEGVRYEKPSKDFNPNQHLSLDYCLHRNARSQRSNYERLGNLARRERQMRESEL
jgi:DNA-binding MarR family transcriptional regulator